MKKNHEDLMDLDIDSYLSELNKNYLNEIATSEVQTVLKDDLVMSDILLSYLKVIKEFLDFKNYPNDLKVSLQDDPEDPQFKAFIILIYVKFEDFKERLKLEREIADLINNERKYWIVQGQDIKNKLNIISFLVIN